MRRIENRKGIKQKLLNPLILLVHQEGFEPPTYGFVDRKNKIYCNNINMLHVEIGFTTMGETLLNAPHIARYSTIWHVFSLLTDTVFIHEKR
jgi:hypothetical protein